MSLSQSFARSRFARFVNSPTGRVARIVAGLALILWGYTQSESASGIVWIILGIIPLSAGLFDACLVSLLVGGPISGEKVRAACKDS